MDVMTVLIPLPRYYNPDASGTRAEVEDEKLIRTAEEVAIRFEAGGRLFKYADERANRGVWWDRGVLQWDVLAALEVDVEDTEENRAWFAEWASGAARAVPAGRHLSEVRGWRRRRHHEGRDEERQGVGVTPKRES